MDYQLLDGNRSTSARQRKPKRAAGRWLSALGIAAVVGVVFPLASATPAPSHTPPPPPAIELVQAQSQLSALVATADARGKTALNGAIAQLGAAIPTNGPTNGTSASISSLWADYQDVNLPVPPPFGATVFTSTQAAASDLVSILSDRTVPQSALAEAGDAILQADQTIADDPTGQGGQQQHLSSEPQFGPGAPEQIASDLSQWEGAFQGLGNQITDLVTSVPQATIDLSGEYLLESPIAAPTAALTQGTGPQLTANGKPEFFYFGAEGCPYCAVERWSMVLALSQFGHFSPLALTVSSPIDGFPGTSTFTFYGSSYTSPYLTFVPVEGFTNQPPSATDTGPGGDCTASPGKGPWGTLQDLSSAQQMFFAQYDPKCNFPFLDVANKWITVGSYSTPQAIQGMSWQQVADALTNPSTEVAQSIDGAAVILTGEICEVTGEQPLGVCDAPAVQQWRATFQ
jgi:hypothetical protein